MRALLPRHRMEVQEILGPRPEVLVLATRPERLSVAQRAWLRAHRAVADRDEARWLVTLF